MAVATYKLEVDWDNNGTFAGGNEDITADTLYLPIVIERGRDLSGSPLGGLSAARMTWFVANDDNTYHPENTGSPLSGNLVPGRDVKLATTAPSATGLFRGHITDFEVLPNPDDRMVQFTALGGLGFLGKKKLNLEVQTGITTGAAIGAVLDAVNWPAGRRSLDTGGTTIPVWIVEDESPFDALEKLLRSEGPGAFLFENGDGDIVFHDRHRRLTQAASQTSQATFRDTGTEPNYSTPFTYDAGWDYLVNDVELVPTQFAPVGVPTTVWSSTSQSVTVAANGGTATFTLVLTTPVSAFVTPTITEGTLSSTEDIVFTQLGGAAAATDISTAFSKASGAQTVLTVTNNHATDDVRLIKVSVRATEYAESDAVEAITDSDATSQTAYGIRALDDTDLWMPTDTAAAIAAVLVNDWKDPNSRVRIVVSNANSTRLTQVLTREINDRVTVVDADSGLNRDYWIEAVTHEIGEAGKIHRVAFDCVAVPANPLVPPTEAFVLDDATQGKLGTGKLGY